MKRHAHSLMWFLYWAIALVAGLFAAVLLALKLFIQNIDDYRADVEGLLGEQLQARVHLGDISGDWRGWHPVINVRGLSIDGVNDQPGASIGLLSATLALDPLQSMKAMMPTFSQFDLNGLALKYDLDKRSQVEEAVEVTESQSAAIASQKSLSEPAIDYLTFLLQQSSVVLTNTRFEIIRNQQQVSLEPIKLKLQHDGVLHQLKIDADLVTDDGRAELNFVAEVEGNPKRTETNFYLKLDGIDQSILNPWLEFADINLESIGAKHELWGQTQKGRLRFVTGRTYLDNFSYQGVKISELALQTTLLRDQGRYQLQVSDFWVDAAGKRLNLPDLSLNLTRAGGDYQPRRLMAEQLDLAALQAWLAVQPKVPADALEALKALDPQGQLNNLVVRWPQNASLDEFQLRADMKKVAISAWDDVPAISGINGLLEVDKQGGKIHLVSQQFGLSFPTLFDYQWQYPRADGIIGWRFEDKGVVVASQLLHLSDNQVSASGRFSIYLPFDRDEQPLLNLQIGMQNSEGAQAKYYIPPEEVGVETYDWLVRAIQQGRVKRAGFVLNGVTRTRLDDYQLPAVQMFFDVEGAAFSYDEGWPAVENGRAFIFFRNGELVVEASEGRLYNTAVDHAWVYLPQTTDKLFVEGAAKGNAGDIQKLLTTTPLSKEVGSELNEWQMSGDADTRLSLNLPLYSKKLPQVVVKTAVAGGRFYSAAERLDFTGIKGAVNYTSRSGLSAKQLTASLFSEPVKASIKTANRQTSVVIDGSIGSQALREWTELDLLAVASGRANYRATLDMCPGGSCDQLKIESDLKGMAFDAPVPLFKTQDSVKPLTVVSDLGRGYSDKRSSLRFNLDNQIRSIMVVDRDEIERARFSFGGARPQVPSAPGIWIDGLLEQIDYEQLSIFLERSGLMSAASAESSNLNTVATASSELKEVDLNVGKFIWDTLELDELQVNLRPGVNSWQLAVDSQDIVGTLTIPQDETQALNVRLVKLRLDLANDEVPTELEQVAVTDKYDEVTPSSLPYLDVIIENLQIDQKPLGRWAFELIPSGSGAEIKTITATMPGAVLKGGMRWTTEDVEVSDLTLKLTGEDFGKVLEAWGIADAIETKSLDAYLQLTWPGAPWKFAIAESDGELQFDAKKGRLIDVGQSGNFLRIFGILNLHSLGRRLRLDFSDLFESGVAFDEMKGDFRIQKGMAQTKEPFMMVGPSANLAMKGLLNLDKETVDMDMEVALPVTDNIPLVSVLLGAPQVAGAVFLFDKLIGDPLAQFTTVKYRLTGDWGSPEIDVKENKPEDADKSNQAPQDLYQSEGG